MSEDVSITIDGMEFRHWEDIGITMLYDGISEASFLAPFDPNDRFHRRIFEPMSFKPVLIEANGDTMITGKLVTAIPQDDESNSTVAVSVYSRPGVVNDNMTPVESYTTVYKKQTLDTIAASVCEPFGVGVRFCTPVSEINRFKKVSYKITENPYAFLINLAQQRDLLVFSDLNGNVGFQKQIALGNPVAKLTKGVSPLLSVSVAPNAQAWHSRVTAFKKSRPGNKKGSHFTKINPFVEDDDRPFNITVSDGDGADAEKGALAGYKRMITGSSSYVATVATWRDPRGRLWEPNTTIKIKAPRAMIYDFYEFLITRITFRKTADSETAVLSLAIHGEAESLPWRT